MNPEPGTRNSELVIRAILGVLFVLQTVVPSGCERKKAGPASPAPQASISEYPSQESWNSNLIMTRAGKRQAVIRYGHMTQYDSHKMAYFDEGVQVDFYDKTAGTRHG